MNYNDLRSIANLGHRLILNEGRGWSRVLKASDFNVEWTVIRSSSSSSHTQTYRPQHPSELRLDHTQTTLLAQSGIATHINPEPPPSLPRNDDK